MSDQEELKLLECRFKCLKCGGIIEPVDQMIHCLCGALGVDPGAGDLGILRIEGHKEFYLSLCKWEMPNGKVIDDAGSVH